MLVFCVSAYVVALVGAAVVEHKPSATQEQGQKQDKPHHNDWRQQALEDLGIGHGSASADHNRNKRERHHHHHHVQRDRASYHNDAISFVAEHGSGSNLPCNLPRKQTSDAQALWDATSAKFSKNSSFPGLAGLHPWLPGTKVRDYFDLTPIEKMREKFAMDLFGGPGIVEGTSQGWGAMQKWEQEQLQKQLQGLKFEIETFSYPGWLESTGLPAEPIANYMSKNLSSHGYYLFLSEPVDMEPNRDDLLKVVDLIQEDVQPLPAFSPSVQEHHTIFAIDGIGSSHSFHRHAPVWQTQVKGRKVWWLLPPETDGTERDSDDLVKYGAAPKVNGQAYAAPNACAFLRQRTPPPGAHICIQQPGEALLLPEDWWHATCAVDDFTVAIGGWMMDQRRPMLDPDIVDEAREKQKQRLDGQPDSVMKKRRRDHYDDSDDMLAQREDHKNGGRDDEKEPSLLTLSQVAGKEANATLMRREAA